MVYRSITNDYILSYLILYIPMVTVVSVANAKLSGYASAFRGHICFTSLKLTFEKTSFCEEL